MPLNCTRVVSSLRHSAVLRASLEQTSVHRHLKGMAFGFLLTTLREAIRALDLRMHHSKRSRRAFKRLVR
jgi:hypothetical protein